MPARDCVCQHAAVLAKMQPCLPARCCVRQQAARPASSRRCMRAHACECMQPAVLAVIRGCMPSRECVRQHAAVFANTLRCSPTRCGVRQHAPVFVNSTACLHAVRRAPGFAAVRRSSALCVRILGCARVQPRLFANIGVCCGTAFQGVQNDAESAFSRSCSRYLKLAGTINSDFLCRRVTNRGGPASCHGGAYVGEQRPPRRPKS
jgi:hypothetical protein